MKPTKNTTQVVKTESNPAADAKVNRAVMAIRNAKTTAERYRAYRAYRHATANEGR